MSQDAKGCKMLQVSLTLFAGPIFNQIPLRPGTRQLPLHPLGTSSCDPHCRYLLWVPPRCLMSGMMISHPKRKNDKKCTVNNAHKTQEMVPSRFHQRNQIKQNPVTKTSREQEFRRNTKDASEKKWTSLICSNCHHPQTSKNACIYRILSINDGSNSAIWLRTHACFALKLLAFAIRALPTSWTQHPCIPHLIATSGLELEAHAKRSNEPTRKPPPLSITIRCLMGQDGQSGKHCLGRKFRGKKRLSNLQRVKSCHNFAGHGDSPLVETEWFEDPPSTSLLFGICFRCFYWLDAFPSMMLSSAFIGFHKMCPIFASGKCFSSLKSTDNRQMYTNDSFALVQRREFLYTSSVPST